MMSKVEEKKEEISRKKYHRNIRWMLVLYDLVVYAAAAAILLIFYCRSERLTGSGVLQQICLAGVSGRSLDLSGKNSRKYLWTGMAVRRNPVLYQTFVYRCSCIYRISWDRTSSPNPKDQFCKNGILSQSESSWCTDLANGVSLCI